MKKNDALPYSWVPQILKQPLPWYFGFDSKESKEWWFEMFGKEKTKPSLKKWAGRVVSRWRHVWPHPFTSAKLIYVRGRKGYNYTDLWSLDHYILGWMPEAIKELQGKLHGYPMGLCDCTDENYHHVDQDGVGCNGFERWQTVLGEIYSGLLSGRAIMNDEYFVKDRSWEENMAEHKRLDAEFQHGWNLMGKHFFSLWD